MCAIYIKCWTLLRCTEIWGIVLTFSKLISDWTVYWNVWSRFGWFWIENVWSLFFKNYIEKDDLAFQFDSDFIDKCLQIWCLSYFFPQHSLSRAFKWCSGVDWPKRYASKVQLWFDGLHSWPLHYLWDSYLNVLPEHPEQPMAWSVQITVKLNSLSCFA